jgi:DNA-binding transcriptional MerR regulator
MELKDGELMTRGDAAKTLGVSSVRIPQLEQEGKLKSIRTVGGFRVFWAKDVEALALIRAKRRATSPVTTRAK